MATRTETLNTMYTTTWQLRNAEITDQIFNSTPLFMLLTRKGKTRYETGGRYIEEPIRYEKNDTVKFIGKGSVVTISSNDPLTVSKWDWKYLTGHVTRFFVDDQQNRGKAALINKVTSDLDNLRDSTIDKLETAMTLGDGTGDGGLAMDGLASIVPIAPTLGTVGGISRVTNAWWRNLATSMSGEDVSVYLLKRARTMYNNLGKSGEGLTRFPDLHILAQNVYEAYEEEADEIYRTTDNKVADLGFGDLQFKSKPLTWTPSCPDGYWYMLNTNYLNLVIDKFKWLTLGKWLDIVDQPEDQVAHMLSVLNMTTNSPRKQGVIYTITP